MSLSGPLPVSPLLAPRSPELGLRLFQRVTTQIVSVSGLTAVLSIEGVPVVAQLTSPDQAARLSGRSAQLIVTQLSDQGLTLKFVRNNAPQTVSAGANANSPEVAARLLAQNQLPLTENHLQLARAVLNQQLPLTPGLLNELLGALSASGSAWGPAEAELAAALKAAGLPVTAQSLALAAPQAAQTGEALGQFILNLQAAGQMLPADLLKQLNELALRWGEAAPEELAAQLKTVVGQLGRSLENVLRETPASLSENSQAVLARLPQMLKQAGKQDLAQALDRFLGALRQEQFLNLNPETAPGSETWAEIGLLLQSAQQRDAAAFSSARLRLAREPGAPPGQPAPVLTRLVLQVDLKPGETVEVSLSLDGKRIRAELTSPNPGWCEQARNELPTLETALQELGFRLDETQIQVGEPRPGPRLPTAADSPARLTVDLEA
jgi:hypothetical protein